MDWQGYLATERCWQHTSQRGVWASPSGSGVQGGRRAREDARRASGVRAEQAMRSADRWLEDDNNNVSVILVARLREILVDTMLISAGYPCNRHRAYGSLHMTW